MWKDEKFIAFDFETSGELPEYALQPWRVAQGKAWVTSLVWARKKPKGWDVRGGLDPTKAMMREMLQYAIDNKLTIIGWNVVFDIQWLVAYGLYDLVMQCKWLDGMHLWRHFFLEPEYDLDRSKKKSYGLKKFVAEYLPEEAGYEEDIDFHNDDPEARAKLHAYNVKDVKFTFRGARHFYSQLEPQQLKAALLEAACLPMIAKANFEGMVVDTLVAHELEAMCDATAASKLEELAPSGMTEKIVRSPKQLSALMFDQWGLPVYKTTKTKKGETNRSTDKETLHELAFLDDRVKKIQDYREALNNKTKFATAPLRSSSYNGDGRTRPSAIVFGTYSGRLTYASKEGKNKDERPIGFALHQMKRGPLYRGTIVPPQGYTLVEFDAAGQEFRWMAIASKDETMLNLCLPGEDPHSYMGSRIVHTDYHEMIRLVHEEDKVAKAGRQLGKVANLSLQYRTSAPKLRITARVNHNIPMEEGQARMIHRAYQQAYPGVPRYWEKQIAMTRRLGYVETFAGRRVQVVGDWDGRMGWSMGSTAINYRIQGTGADQKYLALAVIRPYLTEIGGYFAWDLHDGIYLYIPDGAVKKAVADILEMLNNLPYVRAWGFEPPIPLPWDCKVGKSWGTLKEWKEH